MKKLDMNEHTMVSGGGILDIIQSIVGTSLRTDPFINTANVLGTLGMIPDPDDREPA